MTTLAICSLIVGSILGARFRVVVLLPVIFLGSVSLLGVSISRGYSPMQTICMILVFALLVQISYFCAALFKNTMMPDPVGARWPLLGSPKLP